MHCHSEIISSFDQVILGRSGTKGIKESKVLRVGKGETVGPGTKGIKESKVLRVGKGEAVGPGTKGIKESKVLRVGKGEAGVLAIAV